MATPYSEIYNQFLASVKDYDLLEQGQPEAERELYRIMNRAVANCRTMIDKVGEVDLSKRDDVKQEFEDDLTDEIIELLVIGMEYYWTHIMLYNSENMHNVLNTRDFTQYASHNMIFRLRELNDDAEDRWRRSKREYIHQHVDLTTMNGLITDD